MHKNFKYKTSFSCQVEKIISDDIDKYIALAGLDKLKELFPKNIDLNVNKDLIGLVANCAVAGRMNANGDSISNQTAINIAKNFVLKYCDIGHKRDMVKGVIVNYGFSKFGSNELLTEEEAAQYKEPFNISLAIILWKPTLNDTFIKLLESSVDPTSDKYNSLSLSWELLFADYDIVIGTKNISESQIVTSEEDKKILEPLLQANGGAGKDKDGKLIYRMIKGENKSDFLIPSGIGLVGHPAAEVKGIELIEAEEIQTCEAHGHFIEQCSCGQTINQCRCISKDKEIKIVNNGCAKCKNKENFPIENKSVIANDTNDDIIKNMKITKIEDINPENLKSSEAASAIIEFINEEMRKADSKFTAEKQSAETATKNLSDTQAALEKVQKELQELNQKVQAKESEELYNQRMSYFDETYVLAQEERQAIASDIKGVDAETFEKIKNRYEIFLKDKSKEAVKAKEEAAEAAKKEKADKEKKSKEGEKKGDKKDDAEPDKDMDDKKSDASVTDDNIVDDAIAKGKDTTPILPNAQKPEEDYASRWAEAFKPENCIEVRKK